MKQARQQAALRLRQTANTQVDTIFYCTGNTTIFRGHLPEVGELHGEFVSEASPQSDRIRLDSILALQKAGHDQLSRAIEFCRDNDLEVFFSLRMNDVHDVFMDSRLPRWKREHPQYCLGKQEDSSKYRQNDPRHWWSALDYEIPEVREYILRILEDVCHRYDLDGIELDWWRMPIFFRPSLDLEPVEDKHLAMMSSFVRRVRAMTERVGQERGRPLLVACRIPMSVERSVAIGLDLETWLEEDLVDMLILRGGYAPMAIAPQVREMTEFGHNYGVPVYACISGSGMKAEYACVEAWRGAAMNIWQAGADGVYTFNFFPAQRDERLSQMGSPETLKGLDKIYGVDHFVPDDFLGCYRPALFAPDRLPVPLTAGGTVTVKLPVGEDLVANAPEGKACHTRLRLRVSNAVEGDELSVKLNGEALATGPPTEPLTAQPATVWFELEPAPQLFQPGDNLVEVQLATQRAIADSVALQRLDLVARYQGDIDMNRAHVISDLSKAVPSEALSPHPQARHWRVISYSGEDLAGNLLYAGPETNPAEVTVRLGLEGWHRVIVGLWGDHYMRLATRLKLTGDRCFRTLTRERPAVDTIEEAFLTCADLTGKDLVVGPPLPDSGTSAALAYVRCEPLSAPQVQQLQADWDRGDCRKIIATHDGEFFFRDSKEEIWELIEPYRHSDVESLFWGLLGDTTSFPTEHGRMYGDGLDDFQNRERRLQAENLRTMRDQGINPFVTALEYAHAIGLQFHVYQRMGADTFYPPHEANSTGDFYRAHPEWRCVSREGIPIPRLSYAYPEVRRHKIDLLAEVAAYGVDGVSLCFERGPAFVVYEEPLVEGFRREFGEDPRQLDEWDERWLRYRCRALTEFMRELRQELDVVGRKLGKRLAISASTFPTVQGNLFYGLDLETWIAEGLVDRLVPRGLTRNMGPIDLPYYAKLTQGTPCSFWAHVGGWCSTTTKARQRALECYEAGAQGLAIWDMDGKTRPSTLWSVLRRLGHIEELRSWAQQADKPEEPKLVVKNVQQLGDFDLRVHAIPATHQERLYPEGVPCHMLHWPY